MPNRRIALLLVAALLLPLPCAAEPASGPIVIAEPSGNYRLPPTAIDTTDIPVMTLDADAPDDEPLPYYRIGEDSYMLYGNIAEVDEQNRGWNGNAGFVVTREGVFVIDALGTPKLGRRFLATIRSVTDRPVRYLLLTHNHPDHSYGAIAFRRNTRAKVIAHRGTLDYIHSEQLDRSVEFRRAFIRQDMENFAAVTPDILIDDKPFGELRIRLGEKSFIVYNTGSHHSHGDLVLQQLPQNILWISDLAFNQRTTYMGDGDSRQAIAGQNWLLQNFADARLMVPGHGSAQRAPFSMVTRTRNYIERLRAEMGHAVEEGIGLQQAVDESDFSDWRNTRLYDLNHRANANFIYREMEEELF